MEVFFYQAECGDAARIAYKGNDGKMHNVFIDSGYERTYSHVLKEALESAGDVDLWIVSHIHDDHIGGVTSYLTALDRKELDIPVRRWLYNTPRKRNDQQPALAKISTIKSIGQGDQLSAYLGRMGLLENKDITSDTQAIDLFGLKINVLSPSARKLADLRKKYASPLTRLEKEEGLAVSFAKGIKTNDYMTRFADFDLNKWKEDENEDNGSSISVLTELNGVKILWLADAHPRDVVSGLKKLGYSSSNPLVCDWVKVTHHGSKGNNSNELYELIRCHRYLFSVNGENIHRLPNKDAIARILRTPHRTPEDIPYELYFTYDNPTLRSIFAVDGAEVFTAFNFRVVFSDAKWIKI